MGMIIFDDEEMFRNEVRNRGGSVTFPSLKSFTLPHDFEESTIKKFLEGHKIDTAECVVLMTKQQLFIDDAPSIIVKVWTPQIM